jgi:hypothetical protein
VVAFGAWIRLLLCLILLGHGPLFAAESVQSLRYGVALYSLFQEDYFESLTELMVAQQLQQLGPHADNAELLRGGISLSYGMDREAAQVFAEFLSQPRAGVDRNRAWFYLARLAWQRGHRSQALAALARLDGAALADYPQALYMQAIAALEQADVAAAQQLQQGLPETSPWRAYFSYNYGAVLAANGQWSAAANEWRTGAGKDWGESALQPGLAAELLALSDRAATAAGYASLAAGEFALARQDFSRVRLHGPIADRALLGYGSAALEQEDYTAALSPWLALTQQANFSPSVRESLLAVPYTYLLLERPAAALRDYEHAAQRLQHELERVRDEIRRLEAGDMSALADSELSSADAWLFNEAMPRANLRLPLLSELLASHEFQMSLRELRDLQAVSSHLRGMLQRLDVLVAVDAEQQQVWSGVLAGDRQRELASRHQALAAATSALAQRLDQAQTDNDGGALANAEQLALWQRLERATTLVKQLGLEAESGSKLALYRGLLRWQDSEQFTAKRWYLSQDMRALQLAQQESEQALQGLQSVTLLRNQSFYAESIASLGDRTSTLQRQADLALVSAQAGVRQLVLEALRDQEQQLARNLGQSRLGIAQLHDSAWRELSP